MHARQQISDAIMLTLASLATVATANVFMSRPSSRPLPESALPALRIYLDSEPVDLVDNVSPQQRALDIRIEAIVKGTAGTDAALNTICADVETVLFGSPPPGVHLLDITNTAFEFNGEGDQQQAQATMSFSAIYYTRKGAPEVML